jgi:hypothetical protein
MHLDGFFYQELILLLHVHVKSLILGSIIFHFHLNLKKIEFADDHLVKKNKKTVKIFIKPCLKSKKLVLIIYQNLRMIMLMKLYYFI